MDGFTSAAKKKPNKKTQLKEIELAVGWQVSHAFVPTVALKHKTFPLERDTADLQINVKAIDMQRHTIILGGSGSGKSTFLARIIEELINKTKCRALILDPNADFRQCNQVDVGLWTKGGMKYDHTSKEGKLTYERGPEIFSDSWSKQKIRVILHAGAIDRRDATNTYQLYWPDITIEALCEDVPTTQQGDLALIHEFVRSLASLERLSSLVKTKTTDLCFEAQTTYSQVVSDPQGTRDLLYRSYPRDRMVEQIAASNDTLAKGMEIVYGRTLSPDEIDTEHAKADLKLRIAGAVESLLKTPSQVSDDVVHYYFSRWQALLKLGFVRESGYVDKTVISEQKLVVLDMPSFAGKSVAGVFAFDLLNWVWDRAYHEWEQAIIDKRDGRKDLRVPTFVVVDEAHNLAPRQPRSGSEKLVADSLRRVAAEGRKYGLFLLCATQRPDKIDPAILSECENVALMRLGGGTELKRLSDEFGWELTPSHVAKLSELSLGTGYMIGPWASHATGRFYLQIRRTIESGASLPKEWGRHEIAVEDQKTA